MNIVRILSFLLAGALLVTAADVSGTWTGSAELKLADDTLMTYPLKLELTQKGEEVSGTIGRGEGERIAIQKGKFEGSRFSFEVKPPDADSTVKFDLELDGNRLDGSLKGVVDGGPLAGKVALSRAG